MENYGDKCIVVEGEELKVAELIDTPKREISKLTTEMTSFEHLSLNVIEFVEFLDKIKIDPENDTQVRDALSRSRQFRYDLQNTDKRVKSYFNKGKKLTSEKIADLIAYIRPFEDKFTEATREWDSEKIKAKEEKERQEREFEQSIKDSIKEFEKHNKSLIMKAKTSKEIEEITWFYPEPIHLETKTEEEVAKISNEHLEHLEEAEDRIEELSLQRKYDLIEKEELNRKIEELQKAKEVPVVVNNVAPEQETTEADVQDALDDLDDALGVEEATIIEDTEQTETEKTADVVEEALDEMVEEVVEAIKELPEIDPSLQDAVIFKNLKIEIEGGKVTGIKFWANDKYVGLYLTDLYDEVAKQIEDWAVNEIKERGYGSKVL